VSNLSDDIFISYQVDNTKPQPYHLQVYQALDEIITHQMQPGDQLPGEPRLCSLFGVSRTVIRQSLDQLLHDGRIIRVMGKGTFVAEPKINEGLITRLTGFHEDMVQQGFSPVSQVLIQAKVQPSAQIAKYLNLTINDSVIKLKRLRFIRNEPLQVVTSYLRYNVCPSVLDTDFTHQSLYAHLQSKCQITIASGKRYIEAVLATPEQASLLNIPTHAPLIQLESISYLADGTPMEYYIAHHRSDRARFEVDLVRVTD